MKIDITYAYLGGLVSLRYDPVTKEHVVKPTDVTWSTARQNNNIH